MTKAVRVTMGLPFCQYAGGTGHHWRLKKWWDELEEAGTGQGPELGEVRMQRARTLPRIQKKREVPASLRCGQACLSAGSGPILRLDVAARAQGICFWAFISFTAGFQPAVELWATESDKDPMRSGQAELDCGTWEAGLVLHASTSMSSTKDGADMNIFVQWTHGREQQKPSRATQKELIQG